MPTEKSQIESQVRAAFIRQEKCAMRVKLIMDYYTEKIIKYFNSYPGIDRTKIFILKDYPILQKYINRSLKELIDKVIAEIHRGIEQEWDISNKVNDAMVREIFGEKLSEDKRFERFFARNLQALDAFKRRIDAGGMNLSRRIWVYTGIMKEQLDEALAASITEGKSAVEISRDIRNYLREPEKLFRRVRDARGNLRLSKAARVFHPGRGIYRSAYKNAMRLARTETNMAYRAADYTRYQQLDFVVGFEVHLSRSHPIRMPEGDICDELAGKYPKNFKFTGWHPQCLCYVTSVRMTDEECRELRRRIIDDRPTQGMKSVNQVKNVPDGFKKWIEKNTERGSKWKSQPYFIRDNFKNSRIEGGLKDMF